MPKKDINTIVCKNKSCERPFSKLEISPTKTWNLISPLPDKEGRLTITIMGSYPCPHCGKSNTSIVTKFKDVEEGEKKSKREQLIEFLGSADQVILAEIALKFGFSEVTIKKAVETLIRQGRIRGEIEDDTFISQ
ncbi:MAG: hypothetical protein ACE5R6_07085 [Candidatus Heimdallarchaeota archaeon]